MKKFTSIDRANREIIRLRDLLQIYGPAETELYKLRRRVKHLLLEFESAQKIGQHNKAQLLKFSAGGCTCGAYARSVRADEKAKD